MTFSKQNMTIILILSVALIVVSALWFTKAGGGGVNIPQLLNYQGYLAEAGVPLNGTVEVTFRLYDVPTGGTPLWTETQNVNVTDGSFSVLLGSANPVENPLPFSVFQGGQTYLAMQVEGDVELQPRQQIVSVAYAMYAHRANTTGFGGTGIDGPIHVESGTHYLDLNRVYNFSSITIDAGATLSTLDQDGILHLKCTGDCVINGAIDLKGKGALGGIGKAEDGKSSAYSWRDDTFGKGGQNRQVEYRVGGGGGGGANKMAGESGSRSLSSPTGAGGAGGTKLPGWYLFFAQNRKAIFVVSGSGGGAGGGGTDVDGYRWGRGGAGGGALVLEVAGNLTVGSAAVIDLRGDDGEDGQGAGNPGYWGAGGGGGAGGSAAILYGGTLTNEGGIVLVTSGSGGSGAKAATDWGSSDGGRGGDGDYYIEKNTEF